jgi:hypothetical protein
MAVATENPRSLSSKRSFYLKEDTRIQWHDPDFIIIDYNNHNKIPRRIFINPRTGERLQLQEDWKLILDLKTMEGKSDLYYPIFSISDSDAPIYFLPADLVLAVE